MLVWLLLLLLLLTSWRKETQSSQNVRITFSEHDDSMLTLKLFKMMSTIDVHEALTSSNPLNKKRQHPHRLLSVLRKMTSSCNVWTVNTGICTHNFQQSKVLNKHGTKALHLIPYAECRNYTR